MTFFFLAILNRGAPQRPVVVFFLLGMTSRVWPRPGARLAVPTAGGLWLSLALFSRRIRWSCLFPSPSCVSSSGAGWFQDHACGWLLLVRPPRPPCEWAGLVCSPALGQAPSSGTPSSQSCLLHPPCSHLRNLSQHLTCLLIFRHDPDVTLSGTVLEAPFCLKQS